MHVCACVCMCVYYSPGPTLSTFLGGSRVARLAPHKQEKEIARLNYGYLPESPHCVPLYVYESVSLRVCMYVWLFKYGPQWQCNGKQQICLLRMALLVLRHFWYLKESSVSFSSGSVIWCSKGCSQSKCPTSVYTSGGLLTEQTFPKGSVCWI